MKGHDKLKLKRNTAFIMAIIGWATLIVRLKFRIETETVPTTESVLRFLSYFTILTNLLLTIYFTLIALFPKKQSFWNIPGILTALAAFMAFVGVAYHLLLSALWNPTGITYVTDQIHHTLAPAVAVIFWYFYEVKEKVEFKGLVLTLIYPFLYLLWALYRGASADFYPYYFLDTAQLGTQQVLVNTVLLFVVLAVFLLIFNGMNRWMAQKNK
jgi:hypothetical protein